MSLFQRISDGLVFATTTDMSASEYAERFGQDVVQIPEPPGPHHEWNGAEWLIDTAALLAAKRAQAKLRRSDFCVAAMRAGLLPQADALAAAKGDWPASFAAAFSGMEPDEQAEAEVRWAAATDVERMNPLLLAAAQAIGATDAQLDQLFGIE